MLQPKYGATLLVAGTSIGAGMLALPVTTAQLGFFPSLLVLLIAWYSMYLAALLFLEVTLFFPPGTNMVSMATACFGYWGKGLTWSVYLLLLYVLNAAYLAALTTLFTAWLPISVPSGVVPWAIVASFTTILYLGPRFLDGCNRALMLGMVVSFIAVTLSFGQGTLHPITLGASWHGAITAIPVVVTAFGFHIIIPSLRVYVANNVTAMRSALWWGSLYPLLVYLLWQYLVFATLADNGQSGLLGLWHSGDVATLIALLANTLQNPYFFYYIDCFSVFIITTSFLGVSLSLVDCLSDGLAESRFSISPLGRVLLALLPPLFVVLSHQQGFFHILRYAGILVVLLLCGLPAAMALHCRAQGATQAWVSMPAIAWLMVFSLGVIVCQFL